MNQYKDVKNKILNQLYNIISTYSFIKSATIVGSFIKSKSIEAISDIDIVIIVDELNKKKFDELILGFKKFNTTKVGLSNYILKINKTFGPLKLNTSNNIVFHIMIYDIQGHINHVQKSPFTCLSWENYKPIYGDSIKNIYPVLNVNINDIINTRRGLLKYLEDIRCGVISYSEYTFKNNSPLLIKKRFQLNDNQKKEYGYHITHYLLLNIYKIFTNSNNEISQDDLISFFNKIDNNLYKELKIYSRLSKWKLEKKEFEGDVFIEIESFINNIFNSLKTMKDSSINISLYRHQKTLLNDGSFLGVSRDPEIILSKNIIINKSYDVGFSSKLKRSKQTLDLFDCKSRYESSLINEIDYGLAEGLSYNDLKNNFPEIIESWNRKEDPSFPSGECQLDVLARIQLFFNTEINNNIKSNNVKNIIVVTHLVVLRMIISKYIDIKLHNLFKINIKNLDHFKILVFKDYFMINLNKQMRKKLRKIEANV